MIRPTKTGVCLAALAGLLYISSIQSGAGLLFLVIGVLVGCYVVNLIGAFWSVRRLRFHAPPTLRAVEGQTPDTVVTVSNPTRRTLGMLEARTGDLLFAKSGAIAPGETAECPALPVFARRGAFPFSRVQLDSLYPFGLLRVSRPLKAAGEILVMPATYLCEAPRVAGTSPSVGGSHVGARKSRAGLEFAGVRPIAPGDPIRSAHWKSSAKGKGLMVKEFTEALSGKVRIVPDSASGKAPNGEAVIDWTARAAGSLVLAALEAGHHVELVVPGDNEISRLSPFANGDAALERLARLTPRASSTALEKTITSTPAKMALCLVLSRLTPPLTQALEAALATRRVISVYLPEFESAEGLPHGVRLRRYGPREIMGGESVS